MGERKDREVGEANKGVRKEKKGVWRGENKDKQRQDSVRAE